MSERVHLFFFFPPPRPHTPAVKPMPCSQSNLSSPLVGSGLCLLFGRSRYSTPVKIQLPCLVVHNPNDGFAACPPDRFRRKNGVLTPLAFPPGDPLCAEGVFSSYRRLVPLGPAPSPSEREGLSTVHPPYDPRFPRGFESNTSKTIPLLSGFPFFTASADGGSFPLH